MSHVLIRRFGTLIDISPDGQSPLDPAIVSLLTPLLTYEHKTLLHGHQRFGPDGQKRSMIIETRHMYNMEEGRLVAGFGFIFKISGVLKQHGITAHFVDISPPKDPQIYVPNWDNCRRYIEFRPRQEECLRLISTSQCGLINATMGFGKTFLFEALIHLFPHAKFDILVKPVDVAKRIVRQLSRTIPNVGLVGAGRKWRGDRVTVYTAGSAHYADGSEADFLLADEVHLLMTPSHARAISDSWMFTRNFGFSATPEGRLDGAHAQLEQYFGPEIFYLGYQEAVQLGLVVPIHVRWIPVRLERNPAAEKTGLVRQRWGIWRNDERNRIITADVRQHYPLENDDQILILTDKIEHAIRLWQHLPEFALCHGVMSDEDLTNYKKHNLLPQNFRPITPDYRENMRERFEAGTLKRVIATDVWATGVDFANLAVLYRADARESEIMDAQAPGRVSRIAADKHCGVVVDCCDLFDKSLLRKSQTRRTHYKALGWTQDWPEGRRSISNGT